MFFSRSDCFLIQEYPRIFPVRTTAHESDDMASRFPESLSEAQISEINEKSIPINKKKATKFGFSVFQYKIFTFKHYSTCKFHKKSRNCNANAKQFSTSGFVYRFQNTA